MNNKLKIRKYNKNDLNQVLELHKKAMEVIGSYKGDGPWDDDLNDIEKHYNNNFGVFLVGEINNKIISRDILTNLIRTIFFMDLFLNS